MVAVKRSVGLTLNVIPSELSESRDLLISAEISSLVLRTWSKDKMRRLVEMTMELLQEK